MHWMPSALTKFPLCSRLFHRIGKNNVSDMVISKVKEDFLIALLSMYPTSFETPTQYTTVPISIFEILKFNRI